MPTFHVPLVCRTLVPARTVDGPVRRVYSAAVPLWVVGRAGEFQEFLNCRFDTGCSTTMMSATRARSMGIPFSMAEPYQLSTLTAGGTVAATVYYGELKVRFVADATRTYRFFCLFSEHYPAGAPLLLGLHDVLETFRVTVDGTSMPGAEYGSLRFETYP